MKGGDRISQEMAVAGYTVQLLGGTEVLVAALHNCGFGRELFLKGDGFPYRARLGPEDSSRLHINRIWGPVVFHHHGHVVDCQWGVGLPRGCTKCNSVWVRGGGRRHCPKDARDFCTLGVYQWLRIAGNFAWWLQTVGIFESIEELGEL